MRIGALYPTDLDDAYKLAEEIDLPSAATFIEPSCCSGFLCASLSEAVRFRLLFNAECWPAEDPDVFMMITPSSQDLEDWSAENPDSGKLIEMLAVEFQSASDLHRFEKALWP